jgi:hypothetical protein
MIDIKFTKFLEIEMDRFGAQMNFLCLLQVSRFVFLLKTNFYNYFSIFLNISGLGLDFWKSQGSRG